LLLYQLNEETGYPDSARGLVPHGAQPGTAPPRPARQEIHVTLCAGDHVADWPSWEPLPEVINENRYYLHLHPSVKPGGPE
jgi:hypothetical protein